MSNLEGIPTLRMAAVAASLVAFWMGGIIAANAQTPAALCAFDSPRLVLQVDFRPGSGNYGKQDLLFKTYVFDAAGGPSACPDNVGDVILKLNEKFSCLDKVQIRLGACSGSDIPVDRYEVNIPNSSVWTVPPSPAATPNVLPPARVWVAPKRDSRQSADSINPISALLLRWSLLFQRSSNESEVLLASGFASGEQSRHAERFGLPQVMAFAPPLPPLPQSAEPADPLLAACGGDYLINSKDCFDDALRLAEQAAATEHSPESLLAVGMAQFANFQFDNALTTLGRGRELLPRPDSCNSEAGSGDIRSDLAYYRAEAALRLGRTDEARTEADCSLSVSSGLAPGDSRQARDQVLKARLLFDGGDTAEALQFAQMALKADTSMYRPDDLNSTDAADRAAAIGAARAVARDQELLGQIFARLDRGEEAIAAMRSARELDQKVHPGNPILASSAEQLAGLVSEHGRGGEKGLAAGPAEEALRILEDNFGEYNTHTSSGNYTMAASLYQRALTERNKDRKKDSLERALKQAEQALRVDTLAFERGHDRLVRDYALTMTIARELAGRGFWSRHWKKVAVGAAVAVVVAVGASSGGGGGGPSAGVSIPGGGVGAP